MRVPECRACGRCCLLPGDAFVSILESDSVPNRLRARHGSEMLDRWVRGQRRCAALVGRVDSAVRCSIYEKRPTPCRQYERGGTDCLRLLRADLPLEEFECPCGGVR